MAETTTDDPIRDIATTIARDPELRRLLENLIELEAGSGCNWISVFLTTSGEILEQRNFIREQDATERRAAFRVVERGRNDGANRN